MLREWLGGSQSSGTALYLAALDQARLYRSWPIRVTITPAVKVGNASWMSGDV